MISFEVKDDVAYIELQNGKANAISTEIGLALIDNLKRAAKEAKVTVLTAAGDKFCAGYDLSVIQVEGEAKIKMVTVGFDLLYKLYSHPQPLLAACNGHAIGLGAFILLCCDNRVGVEGDYKIGLPETAAGMPFPPLLVTILHAAFNRSFFTSAALQSQMLDPKTAIKAGFLDMLVPQDQLEAAVQKGASMLKQFPKQQYGANKLALREPALNEMRIELAKLGVHHD